MVSIWREDRIEKQTQHTTHHWHHDDQPCQSIWHHVNPWQRWFIPLTRPVTWISSSEAPLKLESLSLVWCLLSICVWCADCGGPGSTDNQLGCPGAGQPARLGRHQPGLASPGTTDCRPPSSPEGELETGEKWRMTKKISFLCSEIVDACKE